MTHSPKLFALFASLAVCTAILASFFGLLASPHTAYAASHKAQDCTFPGATFDWSGGPPYYLHVYTDLPSGGSGGGTWVNETTGDQGKFVFFTGDGYGSNATITINQSGLILIDGIWNGPGQSCTHVVGTTQVG